MSGAASSSPSSARPAAASRRCSHIIGGLASASSGKVRVEGEAIAGPHPAVGMVFQEESCFPWRNVIDNVAFPLETGRAAPQSTA